LRLGGGVRIAPRPWPKGDRYHPPDREREF
jgi:hypothetical protein